MKIKFKVPKLPGKKKRLRATAARRPLRIAAANYDEMTEPNIKLSRALLIVLVLHIVAVSGIIAFNAIKTRQSNSPMSIQPVTSSSASAVPMIKSEATPPSHHAAAVRREETKSAKPVVKQSDDTHKTYTVGKGENPVAIAKKLKVSYDELLSLNHIDDPRKLQIGQKLLIPNKTTKGKKGDE